MSEYMKIPLGAASEGGAAAADGVVVDFKDITIGQYADYPPYGDGRAHCIIDGNIVPPEREKFKSITCSDECARIRRNRLQKGDRSCLCVVCTQPLDEARQRFGSITCCTEHGKLRKASLRGRMDQRFCHQCNRPATPIERAAYRRFRKFELMRPDIIYPAAFKAWQQDGGDLTSFAVALEESFQNREPGSAGRFDLGLIDRRSKHKPGGAVSGRPANQFEGGDPDCVHTLTPRRTGVKPRKNTDYNKCTKCGAMRRGAPQQDDAALDHLRGLERA